MIGQSLLLLVAIVTVIDQLLLLMVAFVTVIGELPAVIDCINSCNGSITVIVGCNASCDWSMATRDASMLSCTHVVGDNRSFNLQFPASLSWSFSSDARLRTAENNNTLFSNMTYRTNHGASSRRRRRTLLPSSHSATKPKNPVST